MYRHKNAQKLFTLILTLMLGLAACAPQVEPTRDLTFPPKTTSKPAVVNKVSRCISPSAASTLGVDASFEAKRLNADRMNRIAILEYLLAEIDPEYTCGTLFEQTGSSAIRSIRVYRLSQNAPKYLALTVPLESALQSVVPPPKSSVNILTTFEGLPPRALTKKSWDSGEVIGPYRLRSPVRNLYAALADSNQTTFISAVSSNKAPSDIYNCSDFSSRAAAQAFFSGLAEDVNRLDGDNDGLACEALGNASRRYRVTLADVPTAAPVAAATPSPAPSYNAPTRSYSKQCYVSGYTRKNGTHVSGYYRSC